MRRRSQTELAVLGALSVEPMSGYAIRESIRDVLGHFWSESFGQIYPKLAELRDAGMVTEAPADRYRSSIYTITPAGLSRLRDLLQEPIQSAPPRNGLLLRLFFGRHLGPEACIGLLREAKEEARALLEGLAQIRLELEAEAKTADHPYWQITLSAGEHTARSAISWVDESMEALKEHR